MFNGLWRMLEQRGNKDMKVKELKVDIPIQLKYSHSKRLQNRDNKLYYWNSKKPVEG